MTEERSKSTREIYQELYPFDKTSKSPFLCFEAIGWLKAQVSYIPSLSPWADAEIELLLRTAIMKLMKIGE